MNVEWNDYFHKIRTLLESTGMTPSADVAENLIPKCEDEVTNDCLKVLKIMAKRKVR